jgi:hypothetical protein
MTGCQMSKPEDIKEQTIHIPTNVADKKEWDGSKGEFPPGRILKNTKVINYKGHGLNYDNHAKHHHHLNNVHGHGGLGYHND